MQYLPPFTACLTEIRKWSKAHPNHVPLFVLIETKQSPLKIPKSVPVQFKSATPESFTPAVFDALDAEITSVFPRDEIIAPDDVRGSHATLDAAVRLGSWPTLADSRGMVVFLMDQKSAGATYLQGHASLRGRILFTNSTPGQADAPLWSATHAALNGMPPWSSRVTSCERVPMNRETKASTGRSAAGSMPCSPTVRNCSVG